MKTSAPFLETSPLVKMTSVKVKQVSAFVKPVATAFIINYTFITVTTLGNMASSL